jgi:hypothetical protein
MKVVGHNEVLSVGEQRVSGHSHVNNEVIHGYALDRNHEGHLVLPLAADSTLKC